MENYALSKLLYSLQYQKDRLTRSVGAPEKQKDHLNIFVFKKSAFPEESKMQIGESNKTYSTRLGDFSFNNK